jgi:hypothetical protein
MGTGKKRERMDQKKYIVAGREEKRTRRKTLAGKEEEEGREQSAKEVEVCGRRDSFEMKSFYLITPHHTSLTSSTPHHILLYLITPYHTTLLVTTPYIQYSTLLHYASP